MSKSATYLTGKADRLAGMPALDQKMMPSSAVSQPRVFVSIVSFLVACAGVRYFDDVPVELAIIALFASIVVPHLAFKRLPAYAAAVSGRAALARALTKLLGLYATYLIVAALYFVFPYYREMQADALWSVGQLVLPVLVVLAPFYVWETDRRMVDPHDALYMVGRLVRGQTADLQPEIIRQYALSWLVKAFFLPLMLGFAIVDLQWWQTVDVDSVMTAPRAWYEIAYRFLFFTDVAFAAIGYVMTLKLFDGHIRSTEPTMSGWLVCIVCYPPFWDFFYRNYAAYEDGYYWGDHFPLGTTIGTIWGCMILASVIFYVWSGLSFGIRFSNLTHRGIITAGPFRLTKHPAYISKNIAWWLISIPFVSSAGVTEGLRMSLLLLFVNVIYILRARTEERHLSADPVYRDYALWIAEHGLLARLRRKLGFG